MSKKDFLEAKEAKKKLMEAEKTEAEEKKAEEAKKAAEAKKAEEAKKAAEAKMAEAGKADDPEELLIKYLEEMKSETKDMKKRLKVAEERAEKAESEAKKAEERAKKAEEKAEKAEAELISLKTSPPSAVASATISTYEKIHRAKKEAAYFWDVILPDGDYAVNKIKEDAEGEANALDPDRSHTATRWPWWVDAKGRPVERLQPEEARAIRKMKEFC